MHPLQLDELAYLHIEDLHREAARRRLVPSGRKRARRASRKALASWLQRAPAS